MFWMLEFDLTGASFNVFVMYPLPFCYFSLRISKCRPIPKIILIHGAYKIASIRFDLCLMLINVMCYQFANLALHKFVMRHRPEVVGSWLYAGRVCPFVCKPAPTSRCTSHAGRCVSLPTVSCENSSVTFVSIAAGPITSPNKEEVLVPGTQLTR